MCDSVPPPDSHSSLTSRTFQDLEMLKMVGSYSCAVANALPSVKAVAKAGISSNDEHGVAKAIERFVFTKADVAAGLF